MDIEEYIDRELEKISSKDIEDCPEIDEVEFNEDEFKKVYSNDNFKWLELFVENSKEKESSYNQLIEDIDSTIENVNRSISVKNVPTLDFNAEMHEDTNEEELKKELLNFKNTNPECMLLLNQSSFLPKAPVVDNKSLLQNLPDIEKHMEEIQIKTSRVQLESQKRDEVL